MEYLIYHLRPYGVCTRFVLCAAEKSSRASVDSTSANLTDAGVLAPQSLADTDVATLVAAARRSAVRQQGGDDVKFDAQFNIVKQASFVTVSQAP